MNERLRADETIERAQHGAKEYQFLYAEGELLTFMDMTTYDQITINGELVGEPLRFLSENMEVVIESHEEEPLGVQLPEKVAYEIAEADAVVKGFRALHSSSYKPAILENGVRVMVPPHIGQGPKFGSPQPTVNTLNVSKVNASIPLRR